MGWALTFIGLHCLDVRGCSNFPTSRKRALLKKRRPIIQVMLRPVFHEALTARARELGITEAEAVSRLVEQGLEPFLESGADIDQARAERQLLNLVSDLARQEVESSTDWNERLTFAVFERLRLEHRPLYDLAIQDGHRDAVNRRIARQIKTAVGAQVKKRGDKPATARAPRGSEALIGDYTLLRPPATKP
ncbi:hypothetical protein [Sphingomonas swuensis]|uniref:hypothetical protein n=1 Tax=Sphingomonas swuensis TaxID=977800 RepID=UPI0031DAA0F7